MSDTYTLDDVVADFARAFTTPCAVDRDHRSVRTQFPTRLGPTHIWPEPGEESSWRQRWDQGVPVSTIREAARGHLLALGAASESEPGPEAHIPESERESRGLLLCGLWLVFPSTDPDDNQDPVVPDLVPPPPDLARQVALNTRRIQAIEGWVRTIAQRRGVLSVVREIDCFWANVNAEASSADSVFRTSTLAPSDSFDLKDLQARAARSSLSMEPSDV